MRSSYIFLLFALIAITITTGCGGSANNTAANNTNTSGNAANPLETKKTESAVTNNAPTITPVVKAYCDAWAKNDEAALRKLYSTDTIKYFEDDMKAEKIKSLLKYLEDDKVSGTPCEARNEQINGDNAIAEFVADKYPKGVKILFVKEGGEWKWTNKYPSFDALPKSGEADKTSASNTGNTK